MPTLDHYQQLPPLPSFSFISTQWPLPSTTSPTWQTTTSLLARGHHQHARCLLFLPNKPATGSYLYVCPCDLQLALACTLQPDIRLLRLPFHIHELTTTHSRRTHNAIHWRAAVMQSICKTQPDLMFDTPRASHPGQSSTRHAPLSVPTSCLANEPRVLPACSRHKDPMTTYCIT